MHDPTIDWKSRAEAAEAKVALLERQVAELSARLNQNSTNSHRPPSTDLPGRKARREGRKKEPSGKKAGGQTGHKGSHRKLLPTSEVDEIVAVRAENCACCGESLAEQPVEGAPMRYQQSELPPVRPFIREYQAQRVRCRCGKVNDAPIRADQTWCTGPRLMSIIAMLTGRFRLARDETTALLRDLLGVELSEGTVQAVCERVSKAIAAPVAALENALPDAPQVFMDETGWKQHGKRRWLWTASTAAFSVFAIHTRRSSAQVRAWLPAGPTGILTADRWSAYNHLPADRRQLCWAILERDLKGLAESNPDDTEIRSLLQGVYEMYRHWHAFKAGSLPRSELQASVAAFRTQLHAWATAAAASKEKGKRRGLSRDLIRLWPAVFDFVDQDGIEPTNNQAERALRPAVLWRKGSFGTRSDAGSHFVARILSVWATCKQQGVPLISWLSDAMASSFGLREQRPLLVT